jgi:hypothetical protein
VGIGGWNRNQPINSAPGKRNAATYDQAGLVSDTEKDGMRSTMPSDPIVAEIRKLREQHAARFGFDIRLIAKDARERDASGDREVIRRAPRRPAPQSRSGAETITSASARAADRG